MAFDQSTRNRLARFVSDTRALLTEEFTRQLQHVYGLDPETGDVTDPARLTLDNVQRETARLLRETMEHYLASADTSTAAKAKKARQETLNRIVREQAFTVLNRLCALRMAEARGLLIESIAKGYQSKGFQLYQRLAGTALGETGDCYRVFLFSVFDEFAVDLPVLFDRFSPQGRLFPRETALLAVLEQINHPDIDPLWAEDETIGWIYQYFNSVEERRQMRAESQAPRNSRELAVRNQFFTPRYVVEFLTDNTLGRIWYEITKGQTALKDSCRYLIRRPNEIFLAEGEEAPKPPEGQQPAEDLSQEELLKQPVYIPHRPLKDPRDIKMLDPACGSMHFGLYAFDLFERIYGEAWDLEAECGPDAFVRPEDLKPLRETYDSKEAFLRDVPRLIIERNIHGIDIDPRAVQIAGLSLWLRAQKSWQAQGIKAQDRPQIQRSNIVCAEPMPGEADMFEEFLKGLREDRLESLIRRVLKVPENQKIRATPRMADALCEIVRTVWKEMELAGEAGSLLKIEESLADAIAKGKEEWVEKAPLFRVMEFGLTETEQANPKVKYYKTLPGEEEDFWSRAEALVLAALEDYAHQAQGLEASRRRMFAQDAARGFALVDMLRHRFDCSVMNPPFGQPTLATYTSFREAYAGAHHDIYSCFVRRGLDLTAGGKVGVISSRSFLLAPRSETFRQVDVLPHLSVLLDLGLGVMDDAYVESAAYVLDARGSSRFCVVDARSEAPTHESLRILGLLRDTVKECIASQFKDLPQQRILYTLPERMRRLIISGRPFEPAHGTAREGMKSFDNDRYLRLWWEVPPSAIGAGRYWHRLAKGGGYAFYYADLPLLLNWYRDGAELKATNERVNGSTAQVRQASSYWYRAGATYSKRSAKGFSARVLPSGYIFTSNGPAVLLNDDSDLDPAFLVAWLNSSPVRALIQMQANFGDYSTGSLKKLPWPNSLSGELSSQITQLGRALCAEARSRCQQSETSCVFFPSGLPRQLDLLSPHLQTELSPDSSKQEEIDRLICKAYGITDIGWAYDILQPSESEASEEPDDENQSVVSSGEQLLSVLLGCALGRWDVCKIAEARERTDKGDAFGQIPPTPVVLLEECSKDYPLAVPCSGILADDATGTNTVLNLVREASAHLWPDDWSTIEELLQSLLGGREIVAFIRTPSGFFESHLKTYSAKPRVAPIYWPLSTPSGSYTLWLYYHRLTDQTLYTCVNDFVDPKLKQVSEEADRLRGKSHRSSAEEKELERLADLELELKDFRDELLRVAKFWKPNLNDGVQITAAPLWKLFQHRQWRNRLKETWEKLEAGEYDWAHLALSIWPERVVRACQKDRSYAIAHDLEDQLWHEVEVGTDRQGNLKYEWQPRDLSEVELNEIIDEVKAR